MILYSVKHRLPTKNEAMGQEGFMLIYHQTGDLLEGKIGFFMPPNNWATFGEPYINEDGEKTFVIDDCTDWVDYWAIATLEEMNELQEATS